MASTIKNVLMKMSLLSLVVYALKDFLSKQRRCSSSVSRKALSRESAVLITLAMLWSDVFSAAPANHFALGQRESDGLTDKHGIGSAVHPKIQNAASEKVFLEFLVLCAVVRRRKPDSELYVDDLLCRIPCIFKFKGNGKQCENKGPFVFGLVPHIGDALVRQCIVFPGIKQNVLSERRAGVAFTQTAGENAGSAFDLLVPMINSD